MRARPVPEPRPKTTPPDGTLRIIGLVLVSGGRAIDVALVESDGGHICRRIEVERIPLRIGAAGAAVCAMVLAFLGDRALQPFAIDCLALGAGTPTAIASALRQHLEICTLIVNPEQQWPHLPEAERVALAAVPHYHAEIASGCTCEGICGCAFRAS